MRRKPDILATRVVAQSKLFSIEEVDLAFQNGEQRCFERIAGRRGGAVMIAPMLDRETVLLVREYNVGSEQYEIALPKGILEAGEDPIKAANREMMEEIGYGAHDIRLLKKMSAAPGYMRGGMFLALAQNLYPQSLPGDEPEPIEVISWSLNNLDELFAREDVSEARTIASLYMVRDLLRNQ